ncbi:MAG: hybrid sensor histidine kinase/response regulator [Pleurocapsa minor GSE-CHR-MK-17-07R]|jgi:signal transduction histidine kinase|nr:hybrid sensor histidine kinase/response regulator [Pleurocapsa minor GSE-CHR-MK 17-07R]
MEALIQVLYIEDDLGSAELLRRYLEKFNCVVSLAEDGESGLLACQKTAFDIVLVDHTLSGINGLDVIRELHRTSDPLPGIIMITGTGDEQTAVDALKSGADDYIVKDVQGTYFALLNEVIYGVLDKKAMREKQVRLLHEQTQLIADLQAFSYAVAHDLKQPLATLMTSFSLMERYNAMRDQERISDKLEQTKEIVYKMNSTLDALILLAQVRSTTTVAFEPVQMTAIAQKVCRHLDEMIQSRHAIVTVMDDMPAAMGYPPWIEEVWMNYLTNALKYGGTPPHVVIGATAQADGSVHYWMRDNGEGFSPEEREKLFVPFSRMRERKAEGHGLGLAIVSMIVRKLGGEIIAHSEPGHGSTFGFALMAADPDAPGTARP